MTPASGNFVSDKCANAVIIEQWAYFARFVLRYRVPEWLQDPNQLLLFDME